VSPHETNDEHSLIDNDPVKETGGIAKEVIACVEIIESYRDFSDSTAMMILPSDTMLEEIIESTKESTVEVAKDVE